MMENEPERKSWDEIKAETDGEVDMGPAVVEESGPVSVETAFLVILRDDGVWSGTTNVDEEVTLRRSADLNDMYRACAEIQKDIVLQQTGQAVAHYMQGRGANTDALRGQRRRMPPQQQASERQAEQERVKGS